MQSYAYPLKTIIHILQRPTLTKVGIRIIGVGFVKFAKVKESLKIKKS